MGYQAITQIVLVVISLIIIFTFVQPKFYDIRDIQDETARFQEAVDNAAQFNAKLSELLAESGSFSASEMAALDRYLPPEIDSISVARDLQSIVEESGLSVSSISYEEAVEPIQDEIVPAGLVVDDPAAAIPDPATDPALDPALLAGGLGESGAETLRLTEQTFTVSAVGTYEQLKLLMQNLERNAYPLSVQSLNSSTESESSTETESALDLLTVEISLITYALPSNF